MVLSDCLLAAVAAAGLHLGLCALTCSKVDVHQERRWRQAYLVLFLLIDC